MALDFEAEIDEMRSELDNMTTDAYSNPISTIANYSQNSRITETTMDKFPSLESFIEQPMEVNTPKQLERSRVDERCKIEPEKFSEEFDEWSLSTGSTILLDQFAIKQ